MPTSRDGELWLLNSNISEYKQAGRFNHEPKRPRKLLLHKRQINKLIGAVEREGMTVVPLKIYFNDKGRAKVEIALAKGKKLHDKRESEKKRDWTRERGRLLRRQGMIAMAERLIGMLIFPRLTQLDMTGPYEVLARLPNTKVHLVAHTMAPVKTDRGMEIVPTVTIGRLSAARSRHGAGRSRPAGPDGRRSCAGVSAEAGGGREIRHLGLHRLAGARRRGSAQGQARDLPLGRDRAS